jgi:hypothetical protein
MRSCSPMESVRTSAVLGLTILIGVDRGQKIFGRVRSELLFGASSFFESDWIHYVKEHLNTSLCYIYCRQSQVKLSAVEQSTRKPHNLASPRLLNTTNSPYDSLRCRSQCPRFSQKYFIENMLKLNFTSVRLK